MEGLIPLVFRAIKKSKTRRHYECLSSGTAAQSYDIADFHVDGQSPLYFTHSTEKAEERYGHHHRRHKSVGDFYGGYSSGNGRAIHGGGSPPHLPRQLVRFRSHRMFSCVTGA